jgi:IclR family transcriptional regulator, blcABC operon repressor
VGVAGPRSPAVHRGARVLDAISSGAANTPAALSGLLGLPKSSIADLLDTMDDAGLIARGGDHALHTGPRWSELSDPDAVAHRLFRACATTDLDGHTISLAHLFGNQIVFVDVRLGRHPLPLTPRPGQRATATACAATAAILSSMPRVEASHVVQAAAAHLGLTDEDIEQALALRHVRRRKVYESHSLQMGRHLACPVADSRYALTLHVPDRWPEPKTRKAVGDLHVAANDY